MEFLLALLFAALGGAADPSDTVAAQAPNVAETTPDEIRTLMQDMGYTATLDHSDPDDIMIEGEVSETSFFVLFYGCAEGTACTSLQFVAGYDLEDGLDPTRANDWNRTMRFAMVYLDDEGDPYLSMDVNVAEAGVTQSNFADTLDLWSALIEEFEAHIDGEGPDWRDRDELRPPTELKVFEISDRGSRHAPAAHSRSDLPFRRR